MILDKLREALAEVETERRRIDGVEVALKTMIADLSGEAEVVVTSRQMPSHQAHAERIGGEEKTYIDSVVEILWKEGVPMHISKIVPRLSELRSADIKRGTIEPSMNRHIAKAKTPKIYKAGPSTYGLSEWKQGVLQPALVQMA